MKTCTRVPNFLAEFQKRCEQIHKEYDRILLPLKSVDIDNFEAYKVIKLDGEVKSIIAWNVTKSEAQAIVKNLRDKLLRISAPNDVGRPYFKLEKYEVIL